MSSLYIAIVLSVLCVARSCDPVCEHHQICTLDECLTVENCECAVSPSEMIRFSYDLTTDNNVTACINGDGCWYDAGGFCYQKVVEDTHRHECSFTPLENRVDQGWPGITPEQCFCRGWCYDDSIPNTSPCFLPRVEVEYTKLMDTCDVTSMCEDSHSTCVGGRCQCVNGFKNNMGECIMKILIDEPCLPEDACEDDNASCVDGTCQCNPGHYNKDQLCVPVLPLGGACSADDICEDVNAYCDGKTCVCMPGNLDQQGACVTLGAGLHEPCVESSDCGTPGASCREGRCRCDSVSHHVGDLCASTVVGLGESCDLEGGVLCADTLSSCIAGTCQCNRGYGDKDGACAKIVSLGMACEEDDLCAPGGSCVGGACQCEPFHYIHYGVCTPVKRVGDACEEGEDICGDAKAHCKEGVCQCSVGFFSQNGDCVGYIGIGHHCYPGDVCMGGAASSCIDGQCTCHQGFFKYFSSCASGSGVGLHTACSSVSECSDPLAECNGMCVCPPGTSEVNGSCVL